MSVVKCFHGSCCFWFTSPAPLPLQLRLTDDAGLILIRPLRGDPEVIEALLSDAQLCTGEGLINRGNTAKVEIHLCGQDRVYIFQVQVIESIASLGLLPGFYGGAGDGHSIKDLFQAPGRSRQNKDSGAGGQS